MEYNEKKRSLLFGLPLSFTSYHIKEDLITVNEGFFRKTENDVYMYKILDVRLEASLLERMFGLGTVHCFGGDVTDPETVLRHIHNAKEIKNFILKSAEDERMKRKTLTTQSLSGNPGLTDLAEHDSCLY